MDQIPSRSQILDWIAEHPTLTAKRDIARAFGIKGSAARIELKRLLREMEADGALDKRKRTYTAQGELPPVSVLQVLAPDAQGDLFARPLEWRGEDEPPRILLVQKKGDPALGEGERILARLTPVEGEDHSHEARLIRRLGGSAQKILGIFRAGSDGGRIVPIDKGEDKEWRVARDLTAGARDGELVEAEQTGPKRLGLPQARVVARLGDPMGPRAVSIIAIHQHGIPDAFPDAVLAEAERAEPAPLGEREDLRHLPFVTIDPVDARDRDDAVLAEPDPDPQNPGGHILWVAIADVAHYVRPGSALDREARKRGNSTYFPDRVVPMLPDALSGDLCSLHEDVDRPCMAVRMRLSAQGEKISHRFTRGMMRSRASLNYAQVQAAQDGQPDEKTAPLLDEIIRPLYAAYAATKHARALRQPLDLDLPERKIELSDEGKVLSVAFRDRFDAHRLIEEFMILANVAAAEELTRLRRPLLFRVHEEPSPEKLDALREVAEASGFTLAKGQVLKTSHLNRLLAQAEGTEFDELLNITTLRSMTQAYYHPENFGHFGLSLRSYAHFTSPIRRYSDLIVHRALILGHGWGNDGLSPQDIETLEETAKLISDTERRSMAAERDTTDRYLAAWLSDRVGAEFTGRISGVQRFGLFVKLDESGADGLIPIRSVGREFFHYDPDSQTLMGADTGTVLGIGQRVTVRLAEAVPMTGGLMLELLTVEDRGLPGPKPRRGRSKPRKPGRDAARTEKANRRVVRTRR
ncbi:ribonuclease R [Cereibacter sphaeroides]|uniref:ribonuclease R n=1 Tax=Cereibacter sphaeroides TaxID=1063 RepID=UPI001F315828|nr:ribonuclease R [Cereibacter sphaeroides]MCE6960865.1 ribonuclease R [Cereibacter sphaeroides]MCE6975312.1 ribonuclease R [Cereibacter sphaeroides]